MGLLNDFAKDRVLAAQEFTLLGARAIHNIFRRPHYVTDVVRQMDLIGFGSLPIVLLTGFFTGAVLALQMSNTLRTFGETSQVFNGVDVTLNMRQGGLTLQGGISTGQTSNDFCDVRNNLPELNIAIGAGLQTSTVNVGSPYCNTSSGFLTQFRGLGSYVIQKIDAQISAVFQSKPGPAIVANWAVPSAIAAQSLGRPLSGGAANITVNLIEPGTVYGNRINQLDLRLAKNVRFGGKRAMLSVDLYNALNTGAILTYNNTYAPPTATTAGVFQQPLEARLDDAVVRPVVDEAEALRDPLLGLGPGRAHVAGGGTGALGGGGDLADEALVVCLVVAVGLHVDHQVAGADQAQGPDVPVEVHPRREAGEQPAVLEALRLGPEGTGSRAARRHESTLP